MSGERSLRGEMEPSQDRPTELAVRVALLSAQRPVAAAESGQMPMSPPAELYPKRMKGDADG
jgi:hypothetical protein